MGGYQRTILFRKSLLTLRSLWLRLFFRPVLDFRIALLGKPIGVLWFDAGHWGAGIEQDIQHFEIMLRFAYRVLG